MVPCSQNFFHFFYTNIFIYIKKHILYKNKESDKMEEDNFLGEVLIIVFLIIMAIVLIPIIIAIGIAILIGATGFMYYFIVIMIAFVFWIIMGLFLLL